MLSDIVFPKRPSRLIVPIWTDTHGGYSFGLMRPDIVLPPLDDMGEYITPPVTEAQRMMWPWAMEDIEYTKQLAAGDDVFFLFLGDATHGSRFPDRMTVTPRAGDQFSIAKDTLRHWFMLPNLIGARFIKGTGSHVYSHGSAEQILANWLKDTYKKDVEVWYHMNLDLRGIRFDIAHHGPNTGSRDWLKGNTLRYYIRSIVTEHLKSQEVPPDIILRGHYHDRTIELLHTHTRRGTVKTWGAICPAYSLSLDDYTKRATRSKGILTVGTLIVEIYDGRIIEIHDRTHALDIRRQEVIR